MGFKCGQTSIMTFVTHKVAWEMPQRWQKLYFEPERLAISANQ
jgi:hypothetical protein